MIRNLSESNLADPGGDTPPDFRCAGRWRNPDQPPSASQGSIRIGHIGKGAGN